jgi:spore coat-associated protein N
VASARAIRRKAERAAARVMGTVVLVAFTAATARFASAGFVGAATGVTSSSTTAADMTLALTSPDSLQVYNTTAADFSPGVTRERLIDVTIGGTSDPQSLTFALSDNCTGCVSSALDTDATNGLQVKIDRCSVAWSAPSGSSPDSTYTCSGTTTSALAQVAVGSIVGNGYQTLSNALLSNGNDNRLKLSWSLPTAASSAMQNLTSVIQVKFKSTQRNGIAK